MHALEAKTCENRRFLGRVSEGLNSVETLLSSMYIHYRRSVSEGLNSVETNETMERWKAFGEFQKDLIVWKPSSLSCTLIGSLSFQKDLIVWKRFAS